MQTVVLVMGRRPIAQGLMAKLWGHQGLRLIHEPDFDRAGVAICCHYADIALIEIVESGKYDVSHCLALCVALRKQAPRCKLLLSCPEQDRASVMKVVAAKRDGCIDDFVFYDSTTDYLVSKLLSLLADIP